MTPQTLPEFVFIGYDLRIIKGRICSVSSCISERLDARSPNTYFGAFPTAVEAENALNALPEDVRAQVSILGYSADSDYLEPPNLVVPPSEYIKSVLRIPDVIYQHPEQAGFELLGYDVGAGSDQHCCSPLSCNALSSSVPTNKWRLLDTYEEALKVGAGLMDGTLHGEPGPYLIWQVFGRLEGIGKIPTVAEDTLKKEACASA